ncbi:MAG: homoserine kinase [Thermodesulfobacteriota bacterium]|nr:homoserine kinase [Thermodesulfobacteriota bacterium]
MANVSVPSLTDESCLSLVGMAGAGKSTVGRALAKKLGWAFLDTDDLLQAHFGLSLQEIFDAFGRGEFLRSEEEAVAGMDVRRCVVATGGSVVYGHKAMRKLKSLGPMIFLDPELDVISKRVGQARGRGLAIAPGQTLDELFSERRPLYLAAADFTVDSGKLSPEQCIIRITDWLFPP